MSEVVRLRPAPKKDSTAAERMRRYRKKAKGVTQAVTAKRQKARSRRRLSSTVTASSVTQAVTPTVTVQPPPVDLIALRRSIADWAKLHNEIDRLKAGREPYNPRMAFFVLGVAFFALLGFAAV